MVVPDEDEGRRINVRILEKLRDAARDMITPTWFTNLPSTFGSRSGGSIKADQWRAFAMLYGPLVLIRVWPITAKPQSAIWLKLTTDLMSALYACTSHSVSSESIALYDAYIRSYLTTLKTNPEYKDHRWVPNYHGALHITEVLKDYGPAYGWWTFPFERLIRELQNVQINDRMGMVLSSAALYPDLLHIKVSLRERWPSHFTWLHA